MKMKLAIVMIFIVQQNIHANRNLIGNLFMEFAIPQKIMENLMDLSKKLTSPAARCLIEGFLHEKRMHSIKLQLKQNQKCVKH
jgi:hypothetical protein